MDSSQWTQEIGGLKSGMGEVAPSSECSRQAQVERKPQMVRPQKDQALNCPRCHSINTKFCYYNNYSLSQPRYFCKTCRRYWTEGGTLRNVPVGGGSRKNKRSSATTATNPSHNKINIPADLNRSNTSHQFSPQNPNKINTTTAHEAQDLNLGFTGSQLFELPKNHNSIDNRSNSSTPVAALELLRMGLASRAMSFFVPTSASGAVAPDLNAIYSTTGFSFQDLRAGMRFSVDGVASNGGSRFVIDPRGIQGNNGGRLQMFPFGGIMKQVGGSTTSGTHQVVDHQNKGEQSSSNGFWNGMLGGGSW